MPILRVIGIMKKPKTGGPGMVPVISAMKAPKTTFHPKNIFRLPLSGLNAKRVLANLTPVVIETVIPKARYGQKGAQALYRKSLQLARVDLNECGSLSDTTC